MAAHGVNISASFKFPLRVSCRRRSGFSRKNFYLYLPKWAQMALSGVAAARHFARQN
jgi:hypothetical protein